jgi:3-deoxy-manno-octulosonate cytidylyltransferase (CMP-KDO synthetase)
MTEFDKKTLVIIPSRIGSTRLPRKSLVKIGDKTMVQRVAEMVLQSGLSNIFVATDSEEIASSLQEIGVKSIFTDTNCPSGTDRTFEAWQNLADKENFEYLINVQGDMPFVSPLIIKEVAEKLWLSNSDIVTPVVRTKKADAEGESNVKVVATLDNKALYFSRSMIPNSAEDYLYHVGVYGYKAKSLETFVKLPASFLEKTERLEQLRALENGMSIEICFVDTIPISIDTQDDLKKALDYYEKVKNVL